MSRHHFRNKLRTLRLSWGLSQRDLALLLGVSKGAIWKYENGLRPLSVEHLMTCEIIFGVGATELLVALRDRVEDKLGERALTLHAHTQGRTDAAALKKLKLLASLADRIHEVRYAA
jgi:transcriptional regulator with XRE-family HTH domain